MTPVETTLIISAYEFYIYYHTSFGEFFELKEIIYFVFTSLNFIFDVITYFTTKKAASYILTMLP
jgi:hypothetical protein